MKSLRILTTIMVAGLFISVVHSMSRWTEDRKIYDDVCYLAQAHLFNQLGAKGLDTSLALSDDAEYLNERLKLLGKDLSTNVCHHYFASTNKSVMQYPPGTGFLLSLFPSGFQVIPLYVSCTAILFLIVIGSILASSTPLTLIPATIFGWVSIYTMINPNKSSFSVPGSVVIGAIIGALTALLFRSRSIGLRIALFSTIGLLLGLSVNLRIANALLASGYFTTLAIMLLRAPRWSKLFELVFFGGSFLTGLIPTLISNHINAGSAFRTTYTSVDASPPDFSVASLAHQVFEYLSGTQGALLFASVLFSIAALVKADGNLRKVAALILLNLCINMLFYISHPIFTPYYAIPIITMSLWTLLWSYLLETRAMRPVRPPMAMQQ